MRRRASAAAAVSPGVATIASSDSAGAASKRGCTAPPAAPAPAAEGPEFPAAGDALAAPPAGARVRVEVLNATTVRGLGRRATFYLRDRGWDVVAIGTSRAGQDEVVVLDRSGHPEWAKRVAHAMGGGRVESRPDTSRYLDVTVILGGSWRPPPEPFHP
ncbi:LytR C-terminal domain-containing protein [Roseisolibacter sp. H3M3-2]|uniref:LytR C-terminal domain-containing protein n=1 Tax=Roseisolibacter sp. H3M3-2 TaxID=3031323 RepID=UPI0023DA6DDE|nr:LytR C-terminal domain-containing protein [Roseisolibacter sp. H3M3-2]MDF1502162.1 LytR C-terminal domain-containing protein [Roseisolibacter sp. H3M3-2]